MVPAVCRRLVDVAHLRGRVARAGFGYGAVIRRCHSRACELSKETYGVEQKWVLLRKLG